MPKSVLDIDINDAKFKEFMGLFGKYRSAVKEMPAQWAAISTEVAGAGEVFEGLLAGMLVQNQLAARTTKEEKTQEIATRNTAGYWRDMAKSTRSVAGSIWDITKSLLKWTALTSVISGLAGAGGLFGIDRMAVGVASGRRASTGVGSSYGGYKAFGVNFGNIVDPGSFLSSVNESMTDVRKRQALVNAGMSESEMQGDTSQIGVALLRHLKQFADRTSKSPTQMNEFEALHLDQFGGRDMLNNLHGTTGDEFESSAGKFGVDQANLNVSRKGQTAMTLLAQQFSRAGDEIDSLFSEKLKDLAPSIEELSRGFVKLAHTVADSDVFDRGLKAIAHGLDWMGHKLADPGFQKDVSKFLSNTGELAKALGGLAHGIMWLSRKFGWTTDDSTAPDASVDTNGYVIKKPGTYTKDDVPDLARIDKSQGYWKGLLETIAQTESGGDPNAIGPRTKYGRAVGLFQIMPGNFKSTGMTDPLDPNQSARSAVQILNENRRRFGNDEQAIAAFNSSPGTVSDAVRQGGESWRSFLPSETYRYMQKIAGGVNSAEGRVVIDINNYTGGSAIVSTNQVAQGG